MWYLSILYLALPAFAANMAPIVAAKWGVLKHLDHPIDFEKSWRGQRIFGAHKTFRGFVSGVFMAEIIVLLQFGIDRVGWIKFAYLDGILEYLLFGLLAGFGALAGDAIKSFFKRQLGIRSGRPFPPFDQVDYILGFLLCTFPLLSWNFAESLFLMLFALVMNPVINLLAYLFKIKKTYW